MTALVEHSGVTESAIRKYLPKPKAPQLHVWKIARFAMEYRDALASKRQVGVWIIGT